ncbi:ROK family transcriptional regulator [Amycolatopsis orientalis]|uniref:ROK family transcriptional regulator n=1 Tax=Amycolatopsis orientalis TaxID=31958 RepID=UPI0003AA874C|nr:ROK family protein [Amycolatopsis orientalis]
MTAPPLPSADRGANPAAVLLRAVLAHGPVARGTVAGLTGLSPAGISRHCAGLARLGLLTTRPARGHPAAGRPRAELDIATNRHSVFGVHIAHHFATLAELDLRGRVRAQERVPHADAEPERVLAGLAARLHRFRRQRLPGRIPIGLGVACGGWVDPDAGMIVDHSSLGWHDVAAGPILSELTGLPTRIDGHARALAAAEALFGSARDSESVAHLFVGNVVDAAFVSGGLLHRGPGSAAGTVAHLPLGDPRTPCACGRSGCLETTVTDWAVTAAAGADMSIVDLVAAAVSGDGAARTALLSRAQTVGRAAALLFDLVNPELLIVTEAGIAHLPECLAALRAEITAHSRGRVDAERRVLPSSFAAADVLAVAAGAVQLDALYTDPHALSDRLAPAGVHHTRADSTSSGHVFSTKAAPSQE